MTPINHIPTPEENKLAHELMKVGIEVKQQYQYDGKTVDIFIPDAKLTIEIDGEQHLIDPNQILSDFHREYYDEQKGIHTLHIPNSFIRDDIKFLEVVKAIRGVRELLIEEAKKIASKYLDLFLAKKEIYISELKRIADNLFDSVELIEKHGMEKWKSVFFGGGFLASRSAECYLKLLFLCYEPNAEGYKASFKCSHDLESIFDKLKAYDSEIQTLKEAILRINKYSGTKIIYPEQMIKALLDNKGEVYGNDYFDELKLIKSYVERKLK